MTVLTFMPQFHDHVREGRKPHTIRPERKRPIKSGDRLSLRGWSGRPRASKQFILREEWCTYVVPVLMQEAPTMPGRIVVEMGHQDMELRLRREDLEGFATADGFDGTHTQTPWEVMQAWFWDHHGKALREGFRAILIGWDTPDWLDTMTAEGRDPRSEG